jgi:SAM-dependent methyltransferase
MIDRSLNYGRHLIESFLQASRPYGRVVDLGAGHGSDLQLARKHQPSGDYYGVEVYPEYAAQLRGEGFSVMEIDIERDMVPLESESVDVVIANQILEHTKEVFWICHEVARVLKVGGSFIVGVPNLAALHNRVLLCLGEQPTPIKTASAHVRGFTRGDVLQFFEVCFPGGFALRNFGGSNFYPFPPSLARVLARAFPTLAWGIFFRFEKVRDYKAEFLQFPTRARLETSFFVGSSSDA